MRFPRGRSRLADTPQQVLKRYFGFDAFRPNQEEIVDSLLAGRDVLGVMPTGAGKSVCYQVPALVMGGCTLVVSPLISLMADQVSALEQAGVNAALVNSTLSAAQQRAVLAGVAKGGCTLLYVAPERLDDPRFQEFIAGNPPSMVAIDEAHCISQWGQDFRPSYTRIDAFIEGLPERPVVCAFTATATSAVRRDILTSLRLRDPFVVVASFDRPNLHFEVQRPQRKAQALVALCRKHEGGSGIVYCSTRKKVEEVCDLLCDEGFAATRYHAGLPTGERTANQEDFLFDRKPIMVATSAFGMGIDKSNVSFVAHYNMPLDLESYYQEAGRAGRDGEPADCLLLYSPQDVHTCSFLMQRGLDETQGLDATTRANLQDRGEDRLRQMVFYCTTTDCLRAQLLAYFDEKAPAYCGNCGNCEASFEELDMTVAAQKVLSCVYRLGERGRSVGRTMVADVLHGARSQRVLDNGFDTLSTYGIMADTSIHRIRYLMERLEEKGALVATVGDYPVLRLGPSAPEYLRGDKPLVLKVPKDRMPHKAAKTATVVAPDGTPVDPELLAALKALRFQLASQAGLPAYVVFSNHTLTDMAQRRPATLEEFLEVSGVGQVKADRYGEVFMAAIAEWKRGRDAAR